MKRQPEPPTLSMMKEPDEVIGLVQGIVPGSKNEWYVSRALDRLQIDYRFQYAINGGRAIRGGQVIDFVVYNPKALPVFVQGAYWHSNRKAPEDILKIAAAQSWFGTPPVLLEEDETGTFQDALSAVKRKIGV